MSNDIQQTAGGISPGKSLSERIGKDLPRRYRNEQRFQRLGLAAIVIALSFLVFLFGSIITSGYSAFRQTYVELTVSFDKAAFSSDNLAAAD